MERCSERSCICVPLAPHVVVLGLDWPDFDRLYGGDVLARKPWPVLVCQQVSSQRVSTANGHACLGGQFGACRRSRPVRP